MSPRGHPLRRARGRPHRPVTRAGAAERDETPLDVGSLGVPASATARLVAYLDRMLGENRKINLTGIRARDDALVRHVIDSLHVWKVIAKPPSRILDIGSGNGFPGVAAACLWPEARTVLVDRTQKKVRAIRACLDDVGLSRVETIAADAAQLAALSPELRGQVDLVVSRATADLGAILEIAAPLLAPTGATIVQWKAADVPTAERNKSARAARRLRLTPRDDYVYELPDRERRVRRLVTFMR